MPDVLIIGGGLAGLFSSILLGRAGLKVTLLEKKKYPFHRVCGEYVSNEVIPFLETHDLFPATFSPARIEKLQLTSTSGRAFSHQLDLGGFGISRHTYDHWLAREARRSGVEVHDGTTAAEVHFDGSGFRIKTQKGVNFEAKIVISAHGKRSVLDKKLSRPFLEKKSPYVGVKYHVRVEFDPETIALHNFSGGYCGVSTVEDGKVNICYMTHRDILRKHGSIPELEKKVLYKNPWLKELFESADFLFEAPEVINEITFEKKEPVYDHLLMAGDAAGSITPLCGNGMAMAIHAAKILSEVLIPRWNGGDFDRARMESEYAQAWDALFGRRLWVGRQLQNLFGSSLTSEVAVFTGKYVKPVARALIHQTHGRPFG